MTIPAGYTQETSGFWTKTSDSSGPYAWNGTAFYLISTGVAGSGTAPDYTQHPSGFWFKSSDNSGPYSYDGTNFWLAGNGGPSGTITAATIIATTAFQANAGAVFELYNTVDKVTNYERLRVEANGSTFFIRSQAGGSGVSRQFLIGNAASGSAIVFAGNTQAASTMQFAVVGQLASGTQTFYNLAGTAQQSGTAGYIGADFNVTETTTGSGTKYISRWAIGGVAKALMDNTGSLSATNLTSLNTIGFGTSLGTTGDVNLNRVAADTLGQYRGTNAQAFRVYNTYIDGSNNERGNVSWITNVFTISTSAVGTGVARPMTIGPDGSAYLSLRTASADRWVVTSAGNFIANVDNTYDIGANSASRPRNLYMGSWIRMAVTTVAALPAAATAGAGARMFVSDALAPAFGAAVAAGGAVTVPVYSTGAAWNVG